MPIGIQTVSEGTGQGVLYLDESGGYILIQVTTPTYTSTHKFHVLPFDSTGTYPGAVSGQETTLSATAQNLVGLLKGLWNTTTTVSAIAVYQVLSDNTGVQPFVYSFSGTVSAAGTGASSQWPDYVVADWVGHGTDGSRWRFSAPGPDEGRTPSIGRFARAAQSAYQQTVTDYFDGEANGPVVAAKTAVVTHAGEPVAVSPFVLVATNKRLRRHFKVA